MRIALIGTGYPGLFSKACFRNLSGNRAVITATDPVEFRPTPDRVLSTCAGAVQ